MLSVIPNAQSYKHLSLSFASLCQDTGDREQVPSHDNLISKPGALGLSPFTTDAWEVAGFGAQQATPQPPLASWHRVTHNNAMQQMPLSF